METADERLPELGEGGMGSGCFVGLGFCVGDECVLELDSGVGCTTLRMNLTPLNCTLLSGCCSGKLYVRCILP